MKVNHYEAVPAKPVDMEGAHGCTVRSLLGQSDGTPTFAMRQFEVAPGGYTPRHSHDYEHEVFVLEGEGVVFEDDQPTPPRFRRCDFRPAQRSASIPQHRQLLR